ncbi:MAG: hypothetical protein ABIJ42_02585 [Acidobacteriota bacterium]
MKRTLRILVEPLRLLGLTIGKVNTFLILCVSFYVVLLPMGLLRRVFSRRRQPQTWRKREPLNPDHFKKQF